MRTRTSAENVRASVALLGKMDTAERRCDINCRLEDLSVGDEEAKWSDVRWRSALLSPPAAASLDDCYLPPPPPKHEDDLALSDWAAGIGTGGRNEKPFLLFGECLSLCRMKSWGNGISDVAYCARRHRATVFRGFWVWPSITFHIQMVSSYYSILGRS